MNALQLVLKAEFFDAILAGTKTVETRTIRAKSRGRYLDDDDNPRPFTHITFLNGYRKDRRHFTIEIKKAQVMVLQDEKGNNFPYMHNGVEYLEAEIDFHLGKIIEEKK